MEKKDFRLPSDLKYNNGFIKNPSEYLDAMECASWLLLTGDEFAAMPDGISWEQVQAATPHSARVVSDPPRTLNLELAVQHIRALDELPRPTLISCRTGPRASAVAYLYAGLKSGTAAEDLLAAAENDGAPFIEFEDYRNWVKEMLKRLADVPLG